MMLPPDRIARITGFGMRSSADGYLYQPTTVQEVQEVFQVARDTGRKVVLRGAGRSYGDASIAPEQIVLDISAMREIMSWDPDSGIAVCQGGVTIEDVWRRTLPDGFWPPVVSGTMFPTLAGALGMNIHGKNAIAVGTLGEHVRKIEVVFPSGEVKILSPSDDLFAQVISGAGLLGVITRVWLELKPVPGGDVRVVAARCGDWQEQFSAFEKHEKDADYMVSWVDAFGKGRGLFHAAWYAESGLESRKAEHQDLPGKIMGFFPKAQVWRILRLLNTRGRMKLLNAVKFFMSRFEDGKQVKQSLVAFSFLLDYVPNWRWAYRPGGFIQYQSFIPREHAERVFAEQLRLQREAKCEAFLAVMKRHRPDHLPFLFGHSVDGYSLALDFKVTDRNWSQVQALCHRMNDIVLAAGGRFYFAKDSTLRPSDVAQYLGEAAIARFHEAKAAVDPDSLLTSELAERVRLVKKQI